VTERFCLGLDIGGGRGRALLLDVSSGALAIASRAWSFPVAAGTGGLGYDCDPNAIARALGAATREVLHQAGAAPGDVCALATSAMRFGVVVTDAEGEVLYAGPNRDARAAGLALSLGSAHGAEVSAATGLWPMAIMPAVRLQWLASERPDVWKRAAHVHALSDWLAFRLCGVRATDPSQAACTMLFDLAQQRWSHEWMRRLELDPALFPELRPAGTALGGLSADAAEQFGLAAGTPVIVGGADTQCGLLGSGVTEPGQVGLVCGTTAPVAQVSAQPLFAEHLWSGCHVVPDRFILESNAGPLGESLEWLARVLYPSAPAPVAALFAEAAHSEPGAAGMTSTFGIQIQDARVSQLPVGDLTLSHFATANDSGVRRHVARAVAEGAAYGLRANLEQITRASGAPASALHLAGGLAQSPTFAKLLADVVGMPVGVPRTPETSALGAALLAGVGAGVFADPQSAVDTAATLARHYAPRAAADYGDRYGEWQRLRVAREPTAAIAQGIALGPMLSHAADSAASTAASFRPRILVTAAMDEEGLASLEAIGSVEYASFREAMRLLTGNTLVRALDGVHVFITEIDVVDVASVRACPDLRVVASCRGDAVNVDIPGMTALGVPVLNAPGRNADAVADLTLAFLLMHARKLPAATEFLRQPGIEPGDMGKLGQAFGSLQGRELWRKTIGLVGLGAVGRKVAERLSGFGAHLLAYDPFLDAERASLAGAELVSLDRLLAESDFVSLHAPVSDATRGLIGAGELARMKRGAFLLNTARAALVDEDALRDALERGQLAGAALDVFSVEPPGSDHPLLQLPNVIATPHVGGNTVEVASHQGAIIAADLARLLAGDVPRFALNPEVAASFSFDAPRPLPDEARLAELAAAPGPAVSDLQRDTGPKPEKEKPVENAPLPAAAPEVAAKLERLMDGFASRAANDDALAAFAPDRDITLHFSLTDLPCACWVRLRAGEVSAGSGAPDEPADVQLRMRAYIFDGMFTGQVNAMEKAMSGELSFTGDTTKAMALQELQRDLNRLYRATREELGDPGDLQALPVPGAAGATAPPAKEGDLRSELIQVVNELYTTQLITATGGNVSARIPDENALWITPSQMFKGDLRPEIMVKIEATGGQPLDANAPSPSSERLMHVAAYRAKREAKAVIHCHAPNATILVNSDLPFLPISTEAAFFDDLPRIPFIMPGTQELADAIEKAMASSWAVLMQNHGILVAGRSLRRAADMAEIIERSAEIIIGCYAVGKEPPVLPPDVVKKLRELGDLVA
jgi:autoinducer 2 (AI-2) kinase